MAVDHESSVLDTQFYFVSYSRRELYFAEALTLRLQQQGISIFFDIQQLAPGIDWAATLKAGYTKCDAVILIASKASLASPYVEIEWDTALQLGKPVIVCLFETVTLPEKLRNAVVFDFRTNFIRKTEQLAQSLVTP
jgi:TIR domain